MIANRRVTELTIAGATALVTILFIPGFSSHGGTIGVTPCFAQSDGADANVGAGVGVNGNVSGGPRLIGNTSGDPGLTGNTRSSVNS